MRWKSKWFVRFNWGVDFFWGFSIFIFLLRYHLHTIKFTLFLESNFNLVQFAILFFSSFQDQMCMTLVIRKKGSFLKKSIKTQDVGPSVLISTTYWEIKIFLVKKKNKKNHSFWKNLCSPEPQAEFSSQEDDNWWLMGTRWEFSYGVRAPISAPCLSSPWCWLTFPSRLA